MARAMKGLSMCGPITGGRRYGAASDREFARKLVDMDSFAAASLKEYKLES